MKYEFDFAVVLSAYPELLKGAALTAALTISALSTGFIVGVAAAFGRMSQKKFVRAICTAYVEAFRNTPVLVQLFFIYFGLASVGLRLSPAIGAYIVITINVGAYCTEIVRAGLEATTRGHIEAGASLAMTRFQVFRHVMLKPALQRTYPALTSQLILVMLGTSVASQIGADELTSMGSLIQSRTFRSFEVYIVLAVIYLGLAIGLRQFFDFVGRNFVYRR